MLKKIHKYSLLGLVVLLLGVRLMVIGGSDEAQAAGDVRRTVVSECHSTGCNLRRSVATMTVNDVCMERWIGASMRRHNGSGGTTNTAIAWNSTHCGTATARSVFLSHFDSNGVFRTLEAWWH